MVCGVAAGVPKGAKRQCQYSGLGSCVRVRHTLGWGCHISGCGAGDGAEAEGRAGTEDADEDGRKK